MQRTRLLILAACAALAFGIGAGIRASAAASAPSLDASSYGRSFFRSVCSAGVTRSASCRSLVTSNQDGTPLAGPTPVAGSLGPAEFHGAYNLPTTAPTPLTIAIVDAFDDPNVEADLATYDTFYGLPACTTANGCFRKVNQSGGTTYPALSSSWSLEIALDVETAHQICQNCKILLVEASSNSFVDLGVAENEAVSLGAKVVSNSYGGGEYSQETQDEASYFHHPGVAITASAGDNGYGTLFPAASRYVTAVGGTTLTLGSGNAYGSETVWNRTGSGCSKFIAKPAWQTDTGCSRRTIADVAADADPSTGAAVYLSVPQSGQTGWFKVGGTSLGSPLIAGIYALAGTAGSINDGSAPYAHTGQLHDVTSGTNGSCSPAYLCTGEPGYDGPTGLGTPAGIGAFTAGAASPDFSLAASPPSQTVAPGSGTSYGVTLSRSGGFSGAVSLSASGLPAGASGTFTPATLTSGSSSTFAVTTTTDVAAGAYPLTITGTSGSLVRTASATFVVQGTAASDFSLGVAPTTQTVVAGAGTSYAVTLTPSGGFSGTVDLSASGFPTGAGGGFSPASLTGGGTSTLTVTTGGTTTPGSYPITIRGTSGSFVHTASATLVVQAGGTGPGDFSLSVAPKAQVLSGGSASYAITVEPTGGFSGQVTLTVSGVPSGFTSSFSSNPTGSAATLTVSGSFGTFRRGTTTVTLVIKGTSGTTSHSTSVTLTG